MNFTLRNEIESDFHEVENLTREAFWNLFVPGCDEHYLVHTLRSHHDFIPRLDFVAVSGNQILGNIMYTRSRIMDIAGNEKIETLTFGPVSVLPECQRKGIGSALINHTIMIARELNESLIIIHGHPHNYCKHGFRSSRDYNISNHEGYYPYSLLVLELKSILPGNKKWKYISSDVYNTDRNAAEEFDNKFPCKKKEFRYSQMKFSIANRAYLR